jgi:hypothetical protein
MGFLLPLMLSTVLSGCIGSPVKDELRPSHKTIHPTVLLSGEDATAVSIAKTWLEDRGMLVVMWMDPSPPSRDGARETQEKRATRLQEAARLGCHWIVDVQTVVKPLLLRMPALTTDRLKVQKKRLYNLLVTVTGTDPYSGVVGWEGQAHSVLTALEPGDVIPPLVDHALADAWESPVQRVEEIPVLMRTHSIH